MEYLKRRWKEMDWGRRVILLIHPALFLLFLIVFLTFGQQQVITFRNKYLRYGQQGDAAVYSGWLDYGLVKYVVSPGPVVEYWLDGTLDSTYTVTEDPTAVPRTELTSGVDPDFLTGIEIKKGDEVWFRGAYSPYSSFWLLDEEGNNHAISITFGTESTKPETTPGDILHFVQGPEISLRGQAPGLLLGLLVSLACLISLLFEDQLFRWNLSFQIRNPDQAEPSEWELFGRWLGWVILSGFALFVYVLSLGLIPIS